MLLVEDDPVDEELVRMALPKKTPYELVAVQDGEQALDYLLRRGAAAGRPPAPPDLVILDLQLPKVSGLEVLRRARAEPALALTPIVILSSSKEPRDLEACARAGANSFVWKAVDVEAFNRSVGLLERYWLEAHVGPGR